MDKLQALGGLCILLVLWSICAEFSSKEGLARVDVSANEYASDSLYLAHYDQLEALPDDELAAFGIERHKSYPMISPLPHIAKAGVELYKNDKLLINIWKSIYINILGYIIAIALSLLVGFSLGRVKVLRALFGGIVNSSRFIPLTAVTGIFMAWFGVEVGMKVMFLAFGIAVYLIPTVIQRIDETPKVFIQTAYTLGANKWQRLTKVYFPFVLSRLSDDIRVLTAISWTYITIAEMLNRQGGIGDLIWVAKRTSRIDKAFALLVIIIIIGVVQDLILKYADRLFFPHKKP